MDRGGEYWKCIYRISSNNSRGRLFILIGAIIRGTTIIYLDPLQDLVT